MTINRDREILGEPLSEQDLAAVAKAEEVLAEQGKVMRGYTIVEPGTRRVIAVQPSAKALGYMSEAEQEKLRIDDTVDSNGRRRS